MTRLFLKLPNVSFQADVDVLLESLPDLRWTLAEVTTWQRWKSFKKAHSQGTFAKACAKQEWEGRTVFTYFVRMPAVEELALE